MRGYELNLLIKQNFEIDALKVTTANKRNSQDERVNNHLLAQKTRRIGQRWETGYLWNDDNVTIPCNKKYAFQRLRSIEK